MYERKDIILETAIIRVASTPASVRCATGGSGCIGGGAVLLHFRFRARFRSRSRSRSRFRFHSNSHSHFHLCSNSNTVLLTQAQA